MALKRYSTFGWIRLGENRNATIKQTIIGWQALCKCIQGHFQDAFFNRKVEIQRKDFSSTSVSTRFILIRKAEDKTWRRGWELCLNTNTVNSSAHHQPHQHHPKYSTRGPSKKKKFYAQCRIGRIGGIGSNTRADRFISVILGHNSNIPHLSLILPPSDQ